MNVCVCDSLGMICGRCADCGRRPAKCVAAARAAEWAAAKIVILAAAREQKLEGAFL